MSVLSKALRYMAIVLLLGGVIFTQSTLAEDSLPEAKNNLVTGENGDTVNKEKKSLVINSLTLSKSPESVGSVNIALSGESAFELRRTAATEYCVIIPMATTGKDARIPQVASAGTSGIRSVRAVENGDMVTVRMFVDDGVVLKADADGNNILVRPVKSLKADTSRAQASEEEDGDVVGEDIDEKALEETARQNPTGIQSSDGSKIYTGRLISLDLQDTDIDNALRIIAEVSNLNIIASDDVSGKVTLRLIDVPWDQALDVILKTNGLDQVTEGNVIRIAPVDKLRQEREALLEAKRAAQNLEDLKVSYIRVSYAQVSDMQPQVEAVLSERGTVTVDERTNQLVIKDIADGQERAAELIKRLDLRTPQILLETQIVEGDRSIARDLGFQWTYSDNRTPDFGTATDYAFPHSIEGSANGVFDVSHFSNPMTIGANLLSSDGSRALDFKLSALENEGKAKVVSRPQVATINNRQAEIKSVEVVRIRLPDSGLSVATGSGATAGEGGSNAFEEIDIGITLNVTPQASPDYYVLLDVNAKSSTLGTREYDSIPSTVEREATSSVLIKSGATFALGGVYRLEDRDSIKGVPFLKDIPFLGYFFRESFTDNKDQELIFFITPHIVEGSFDPGAMRAFSNPDVKM